MKHAREPGAQLRALAFPEGKLSITMDRTPESPGRPKLAIRRGRSADAADLARLAERTFREAYSHQNRAEDMDAYVAENLTLAAIEKDLADARSTYLLGSLAGTLVAYAKLYQGEAPPCVVGPAPIELSRFYVAREHHGSGLAKVLMNAVLVEAKRLGGRTVWLGVWEKNARARAFYAKHRFKDVGEHPFVLGSDVQSDRVLVWRGKG